MAHIMSLNNRISCIVGISIKLNTFSRYVLNPKMEIPTRHEIRLFRIVTCTIILFFGATYAITLFTDSFFVCQTYTVTLLELSLFETRKEFFSRDYTVDCRFVYIGIRRLCCCMSFLLLMLLS